MAELSVLLFKRITAIVALLVIAFYLAVLPTHAATSGLRAGAARIDITPEKPIKMAGYGARTALSEGVHDPLSARVVAFENNGKRLILVSSDLIGFYRDTSTHFRRLIVDEFRLDPSELFLSSIHTHGGPTLTIDKENGHPNNLEYTKSLEPKLIEVIRKAMENMAPVRVGADVGYSPVGVNRRELRFDGTGNSQIRLGRNPYGPTDKEVLVMKLTRADGSICAALFDYASHATCMGGKNLIVTGDILGLCEQFVEKILGPDVIAAGFAGASGNIDPWFRVLPSFNTEPGWVPEPVLLGTFLGEEVVHVFRDIDGEISGSGDIATAFVTLELPGKPRNQVEVSKDCPPTSLNVSAARVGNIAFVGLGAEVLTEIGMAIKAGSPYEHTFVITHCNGASSYLPPEHLYIEGGYEITSSPFAPQAAEMVVKQAVKMLHELQENP
ncbi:MAG: neutral/alkaline non-lysosomal ceramidase N-terminal domain-containing protein [Phycisphaerales bacterium]|nr:MAG: neutral/alkaline non-lysosomal ceramidase N-terminal domain-containing protein [Phycisphaerales bacterium]